MELRYSPRKSVQRSLPFCECVAKDSHAACGATRRAGKCTRVRDWPKTLAETCARVVRLALKAFLNVRMVRSHVCGTCMSDHGAFARSKTPPAPIHSLVRTFQERFWPVLRPSIRPARLETAAQSSTHRSHVMTGRAAKQWDFLFDCRLVQSST